jgi:ribosome assembly protein 1
MEGNNQNRIINNVNTEELHPFDLIRKLQQKTENIRNICVLAHVDHGKTSLVDSLISYNNIINPRLAGDIRYMDSRPDEQERCITMKSSSISITYGSESLQQEYLINLIDSPGHVDFSSEIFSALKICDGAIIVIDVVEGVCSQTESVIKQAWDEKIRCVLVLNKIDRLITEIQLEPLEAYLHLNNLLEKVNSLMGSLIVRDINIKNDQDQIRNGNHAKGEEGEIDVDQLIEEKENELYFSPDKGNVVFASALDNWGFTLNTFSEILSKKIGFKKDAITKMLWGDFYFNAKKKKVYTDPELANNTKPMFVEFVLENIYKLYKMILVEKNAEKLEKAAKSINVVVNQKELNSIEKNSKTLLKNIFRQWLPAAPTVFDVTIKHLPNPIQGCKNKLDILFPPYKISDHDYPLMPKLRSYLDGKDIQQEDIPTVAFISKMVPISRKNISGEVFDYETERNRESKEEVRFMAFARNYAGALKKGQEYFVIGPKHDPKSNIYDIQKFKFDKLYFFMGQYLEEISEVPPGNIFSVGGLENYVYKTATISKVFDCPSIIPSNINKNSIIKVSITTEDIKDMSKLIEGLKKLYKSDPAVDYYVQSNGEHILATAGEVHLERCIKDLEDTLAKVKVKTSPPIVNFKEGLANKSYQMRRRVEKDAREKEEEELAKLREKERKQNFTKYYVYQEGEENIDLDDQDEILKSCTPMLLTRPQPQLLKKKADVKDVKHKVKDIKNIKEKANFYIEKNVKLTEKANEKSQKSYAEDTTPNKQCKIGVSAVGMTNEVIELIEKNENLLKEIDNRNFIVSKELFDTIITFKENLLNLIENKRLKQLIESNLLCFGLNNCGQNMLIVKNISKRYSYFNKIRLEGEQIEEIPEEEPLLEEQEATNSNLDSQSAKQSNIESEKKSISNKASYISGKSKNTGKSQNKSKNPTIASPDHTTTALEDEISIHMKNQITPKEFMSSVKSGFDLAVQSGPMCEEDMYGVIFIIEDIIFAKHQKDEKEKDLKPEIKPEIKVEDENEALPFGFVEEKEDPNDNDNVINQVPNQESVEPQIPVEVAETKEIQLDLNQNDNKSEDESVSSKKLNIYGPFLGQLIGTVKDCCRKAFLNGEPRLFEAIYLCLFQIRQEYVGKIHSVVSRRRGTIMDELSNDESIMVTIEAVVPVVESFGFVEEIRKNTSGMANPMLQFYKWQMIDVDPFYVPIDQETIDNFGVNIDAPNLAKNYINKIRMRKGLPIDEKIVKNADKQKNLSKKR